MVVFTDMFPDSKVHGANMGLTWGQRQDPGGPHVGLMNLAIWVIIDMRLSRDVWFGTAPDELVDVDGHGPWPLLKNEDRFQAYSRGDCHDEEPHHGWALIARFMGPTWGPSGTDRTQMGPMMALWTLPSGRLWIILFLNLHLMGLRKWCWVE